MILWFDKNNTPPRVPLTFYDIIGRLIIVVGIIIILAFLIIPLCYRILDYQTLYTLIGYSLAVS